MLCIKTPPAHPLVAASILSADFGTMVEQCRHVLDCGADLLHVDVMDGHFAPNLTMGQDMIRALRQHLPDTFLDVHLMVERPGDYIASFADAGASLFCFHLEVCQPTRPADRGGQVASDLLGRIRDTGMHTGMAINPDTGPEGLEPYLDELDLVLVMSVNPGYSGQRFMPEVLDKARWLKARLGTGTRLAMDGGIKPDTAPSAVEAGVDLMVTASGLFAADDRAAVVRQLHEA